MTPRACGFVVATLLIAAAPPASGAETPPLVAAARAGDMAAVRALLDAGADVTGVEADGTTALHWAAYHDDPRLLDRLIAAGAEVDAANDLGVTALWTASQNGSLEVVERLLGAGADPDRALLSGETPLMVAARVGAAAAVGRLLEAGAAVDARATRGQTALMWAAAQRHPEVVSVLLAHGADLHTRSDTWSQMMAVPPHGQPEYNRRIPHGGNTALLFAARDGAVESARRLIAAGADVDDTNAWGVSAVTLAAHAGYGEIVALLLEAGADASAGEAGFAALHAAILRRDEAMVASLLAHGADPNAPLRTWTPTRRSSSDFNFAPPLVGASPFWLAARFTAPGIMRLLADHGADPLAVHHADYKDPNYARPVREATTALMAAVGMGGGRLGAWVPPARDEVEPQTLDAVRLALDLGVDVNATDTEGRTALDGARRNRLDAVAALLESRGAVAGTP